MPPSPSLSTRSTALDDELRRPNLIVGVLFLVALGTRLHTWYQVPGLGMTVFPAAFAALLAAYVVFCFRPKDLQLAIARSQLFFAGFVLAVVCMVLAYALKDHPFFNAVETSRVIQVGVGIYLAAMLFGRSGTPAFNRLIAWSGPIIALYFVYIFIAAHGFSLVETGRTVVEGLRTGDPNQFTRAVVYAIFEATAQGVDEAAVNLGRSTRHSWSGALLVALLLSIGYARYRGHSTLATWVWTALVALNAAIILGLMSRAVLVGLCCGYLGSLLLPGRGKGTQLAVLIGGAVVGAVALAVSGVGALLYNHFFVNTASLEGRAEYTLSAFARIEEHVLFGAEFPNVVGSAHNWIIDLWQGTGVVGMFAGVLTILYFVIVMARMILDPPQILKEDERQIYLVSALLCFGTYVVIRFLSSGNGIIGPHEGMGAGIFMALAGRVRESEGMASASGRAETARHASEPGGGDGGSAPRRIGRRWQSGLVAGHGSPRAAPVRPAAGRLGERRARRGPPPAPT